MIKMSELFTSKTILGIIKKRILPLNFTERMNAGGSIGDAKWRRQHCVTVGQRSSEAVPWSAQRIVESVVRHRRRKRDWRVRRVSSEAVVERRKLRRGQRRCNMIAQSRERFAVLMELSLRLLLIMLMLLLLLILWCNDRA